MAEYVRDEFTRANTASGWGTAPVGGVWSTNLGANSSIKIEGNQGRIYFSTGAGLAELWLPSATAARDAHMAYTFRVDPAWLGGGTWTGTSIIAWLRHSGAVGAFNAYYAQVIVKPGSGDLVAAMGRVAAGVYTGLYTVTVAGYVPGAGGSYRVEFYAVGTPTKLGVRVWNVASGPPAGSAGWIIIADDTGPQTAGAWGIRPSRPAPATDFFQTLDIADIYASDPPVPDFTYTATALAATFATTGTTGDFTAYSWDWGDGTTAGTGSTPSHTYATGGTYLVKLTGTTRWGATFTGQGTVSVAAPLPAPPELLPSVKINGVEVCTSVYSVTWNLGRAHWTEGFGGQTASIRLRGIFSAAQGQSVTIAVPNAVSGTPLWVGTVDQVTETNEPVDAHDETMIIAMDSASFMARRHLRYNTILSETRLPTRLDDLKAAGDLGRRGIGFRYGYAGYPVDGTRWPLLHRLPLTDQNLDERTYLDMVGEALTGSIAFAYVAPDADVVYAPWEAPAGLPSTPRIDLNTGIDCASRITLDRNNVEGMVNRWTEGKSAFDFEVATSIETYGERAYSIPDDVLTIDGSLPHTTGMRAAMADPLRAAEVEVPVTNWAQKVITAEPLDFATWNTRLYSIVGIRHEVTVGDAWRCTLNLDRNPWEIDGRTPP